MNITFSDEVPEEARQKLAWVADCCFEVGIPVKTLRTIKPGTDPNNRRPEDSITYTFELDELGDCFVSIAQPG